MAIRHPIAGVSGIRIPEGHLKKQMGLTQREEPVSSRCRNKFGKADGIIMKTRINLAFMSALALTVIGATLTMAQQTGAGSKATVPRPKGPCDIYAAGDACVAAHSTTRALYASYNGPLYQVLRQSDGKTLDIGIVQPNASRCGRIRRRGRAGRVLRQHLLLDHHRLRPISQAQRPHSGASRRFQRPGHGWV